MSDEPTLDYIDYTSIAFPSDSLTFGKLRKLYPEHFDVEGDGVSEFFEGNVSGQGKQIRLVDMITAERYLARHAFEEASGKKWTCLTELGDTRDQSAEELGKRYIHFGLATDLQHADQLIRAFEAQAAAQGKPPQVPLPPSRPSLGR
jgi:hypothetical protein